MRALLAPLAAGLLVAGSAVDAAGGAAAVPWELQLAKGRRAPTTVSASNKCQAAHRFEARPSPALSFLGFPSGASVEVPAGSAATIAVLVDATKLDVGEIEGDLDVVCTDCGADPLCSQDRQRFRVRLKVLWPEDELARLDRESFTPGRLLLLLDAGGKPDGAALPAGSRSETWALPSIGRTLAVVTLPQGSDVAAAAGAAQKSTGVRIAQPDFVYTVDAGYNDPYAKEQWGPERMGIVAAHALATGKGVRVAVLDSGIDARHPDLDHALSEKLAFVDGGRYEKDPHGTAMTGALAARANNKVGIYGVAPDATILSGRVCRPKSPREPETCETQAIARGLDFAIGKSAQVVSMSLGGPYDPIVRQLVDRAIAGRIAVVAAAGNSGPSAPPRFPASLPSVIAVSAYDAKDRVYERGNRGPYVKVCAPGVDVLTLSPDGRYAPSTGTSVATAQVSGVVALLLQVKPSLAPAEIEEILTSTARDLGAPGRDDLFGFGAVDACRAVGKALGKSADCP